MAIDLVDLVKGYLTPDIIQKAATQVGESNGATQKALAGIVPTLVGALANTASTNDGAQQLVRMLDAGKYDGSVLNNVTSLFGGGAATQSALSAGKGILDSLFGAKLGGVGELIARFAGVRAESASSLLALAAPLVMHVLGRQRPSIGPGPSSLTSLLGEQRSSLVGLLPAGIGSLLGWSGVTSGVSAHGSTVAGRNVQEDVMAIPQERFRTGERVVTSPVVPLGAARVSWGGVWSGLLTALGALLLLGTLGLAIGISAASVGTGEGAGAKGLGIGAGIWGGLSLLVALFLGGLVSTWVSPLDRLADVVQGTLVWVLAMLGILYLAASGVGLGASALFGMAGVAAQAAGGSISTAAAGLADLARGDVDQVLARLNDPTTVATVAGATGMTQEEARGTLADIRRRVEAARNDPARAVAEARAAAEQLTAKAGQRVTAAAQAAQPYAATTSWVTLGAMVLSLLAAVAGAVWGGNRAREAWAV